MTLTGLGLEAFGIWALLQTFSTFTGWLAALDLGVGAAASAEIATADARSDPAAAREIESTSAAWSLIVGLFGAVAFAVFATFGFVAVFHLRQAVAGSAQLAATIFAVQIAVDTTHRGLQFILEGHLRTDLARAVDAVRRTLCVGGAAAVAVTSGSLVHVAAASCIGAAIPLPITLVLVRRVTQAQRRTVHHGRRLFAHGSRIDWRRPVRRRLLALIQFGRHIALVRFVEAIQQVTDRTVVGLLINPGAVGLVEIASQVASGAHALQTAMAYALTPAAAHIQAQGDRPALRAMFVRGARAAMLVVTPIALVVAILAAPLLKVWLGFTSGDTALMVSIAMITIAVTTPTRTGMNVLIGVGRASIVAKVSCLTIATNVVCSVLLVMAIGAPGSFLATLLVSPLLIIPIWRELLALIGSDSAMLRHEILGPVAAPALCLVATSGMVTLAGWPALTTLVVGAVSGLSVYAAVAAGVHRRNPVQSDADHQLGSDA
jgi:O-antigen/teichoic acid export membrane protein